MADLSFVDPFTTVISTETYLFAAHGPIILGVWRTQASTEGIEAFAGLCDEMRARYPHFAFVGIAESDAPMPETVHRKALVQVMRNQGSQLVGVAFVIEGGGFRAATMRSVAIGLTLLVRQPFPFHIVSSLELASQWVVDRLAEHGTKTDPASSVAHELSVHRAEPPAARRLTG